MRRLLQGMQVRCNFKEIGIMANIEVLLNGSKVTTEDNITILELAKNNSIEIPTLCKDPRLKPITSCFLCVVEVKGAKTLVPSCSTFVTAGMEISTNTAKVMEARKAALELILSNHYGDCHAPCKLACPAGCDVQGYVGLIANGKYADAIKLVKETIPLPASIGRVCPKFCEDKCRRQFVDKSVGIDYLKRFVADIDLSQDKPYSPELKPQTGKKVAIVGGGPAGLSCAYYLAREGVRVEIFESKPLAGGMLVYGIPEYRLPKEIVAKEISLITGLGVIVNYNKRLGKDFTIDDLEKQGFDAVLLAMGAWKSRKLDVENEDVECVYDGIKFLEELNEGKDIKLKGRVAIVGGGNTAFDCARSAVRCGADEVIIVYRRTRDEMPANEIEIIEAEEEGIKFQFLNAPVKINAECSKLTGMECVTMELGEPDASGRRSPKPVAGSNCCVNFDYIISAVGQAPDYSCLGDYKEKLVKNGKWINYNKDTMQTEIDYVFTAGDYALGPATVVEALGTGKKACQSILKYINGEKVEPIKEFVSTKDELSELTEEYFAKWEKQGREMPDVLPAGIRKKSFDEIEDVYTADQALAESNRCLECGCMDVYQCSLKNYSTEYGARENHYAGELNRFEDDNSHGFIYREPEKCILCGRCINLCKEKVNIGVYGFINRGFSTIVGPAYNEKLSATDCISCGLCISGCPVGAITPKAMKDKRFPIRGKLTDSSCFHCSIACDNTVETLEDSIYEIHERPDYLCKKGRFDFPARVMDFDADYEVLKKTAEAVVYPSPDLSAEDYEAMKAAASKMNWKLANYYSQSTLCQAFAGIKKLPKMDFFTKGLTGKSLVVIAGDIENNHPVAINRLSDTVKEDTRIILINREVSLRLDNLGCELMTEPAHMKSIKLDDFNEIVLLINPVNFDEIYGANASFGLYNYLAGPAGKLRTTLFSPARNLYSMLDADKTINAGSGMEIFINTKPFDGSKNFIRMAGIDDEKEFEGGVLPVACSFQHCGSFLDSRNRFYANNPFLTNGTLSLREIMVKIFNVGMDIELLQHGNADIERPFSESLSKPAKFPEISD